MKDLFKFVILLLVLCSIAGCSDDDDVNVSDYDTVQTEHDSDYWDNNVPTTYYLIPAIQWLHGENGEGNSNPNYTGPYNTAIINAIRSNMTDLGYEEYTANPLEDESNPQPDLVVGAQAVASTYTEEDYYYWDDWWGVYDPYYPWYGGGDIYPVYYQYTEGSIIIEMGNYSSLDVVDQKINIVWGASINGLVRDSQQGNIDFITNTINTAFNEDESILKVTD